jgi:hypothetical protein
VVVRIPNVATVRYQRDQVAGSLESADVDPKITSVNAAVDGGEAIQSDMTRIAEQPVQAQPLPQSCRCAVMRECVVNRKSVLSGSMPS